MVIKAKSETTIQPLRNVKKFDAWKLPTLDGGNAPSFRQPVEEVPELSEQQQLEIEQKELQAIKDAAYQQGFSKGQEDGLAAVQVTIDQQTAILKQMVHELAVPTKQCGEKTQKQLLELAFAIAHQIVRRELQQDPHQIMAIIRDGLKILPIASQKIVIGLHPEDASFIKQKLLVESESDENEQAAWQIKADPAIERGGCQIITENSRVNGSIDQQVAVIFSKLVGGLRAGESAAPHALHEVQTGSTDENTEADFQEPDNPNQAMADPKIQNQSQNQSQNHNNNQPGEIDD